MSNIKNVSVIGAGTMGNGIAHVFAMHNFKVNLVDVSADALEKAKATISKNLDRMVVKGKITEAQKTATLQNISTFTNLAEGVSNANLVVEAATENVELKLNIFKQLDENAPADCILASNTSSISLTKIAAATKRPEKVIGMHFMNPVPVMKLVEVIKGYSTSDVVNQEIITLSKILGKIPVLVNDYPGFVANRILIPMINEAIYTLFEGVAGVEEIIGLDVVLAITKVLYDGLGNQKYAACPLLVNMVTAGKLGRKTGEGFYTYTKGSKEIIVSMAFKA